MASVVCVPAIALSERKIAPTIIGAGTEAVGTLGITSVADGIRLVDRSVYVLEDDMLLAWDVAPGSNPSKLPGRKDERAV